MIPKPHQTELAKQGYEILKANAICYLAMEERTGKTLTSILIAEMSGIQKVLVITKKGGKEKKTLQGWLDTLKAFKHTKEYTVTTYHQLKNLKGDYDLVIIDEAHNYISGFPKISAIWRQVRRFTKFKPILYLSATPSAQTRALLYHQFALSDWSPWKTYSNYYSWYNAYGTGKEKWISGRLIKCYEDVKDTDVYLCCEHLFITKTRKELGFKQEPSDKVHYIELSGSTKKMYNTLVKDKVIEEPIEFIADTVTLLRTGMHQLEGGTLKTSSFTKAVNSEFLVHQRKENIKEGKEILGVKYHNYHVLCNDEKIQYILGHWGDSPNVVIMYNYIAEEIKLKRYFNHAKLLQATSSAEGIDLSHIKHLIIYSQDFSTARHNQRRARQANMFRTDPIVVHYLLVKKGISEQVYNTVTINKQNYIDSMFIKDEL